MDPVSQVIVGLLMAAAGVVGLRYTFQLLNFTGNVGFAEKWFGGGGTYTFYKIGSVILAVFGLLFAFGLGEPLLRWVLSPLINLFPQTPN